MNIFPIAKKINPFWKRVAQTLSEPCKKCGIPRLYSVFDSYITGDAPDCPVCSAVYLTVLPLIKFVFGRVNLSKEDAQTLMSDILIRKSMLNVIRGVSHFGLRAPQPTAVPVVIVWNFTNRCNLNCLHCHQNSGESQERELTTDEALTLIDRLGNAGLSILTFSGGEPLVRPDIYEAVEHANDAGMLCTIASNGTLMTKDAVKKLKRAGITRVEIGLDGCRDETHDFLRNNQGSFSKTVQGIRNCVEEGFDEVCATMTLHEKNITELEGTVELAEELGVNRFYLNRLIPAGRGKDVIDLDVTKEEKIKALQYIYTKFYESVTTGKGIQCYSRGMTYYGRLGYEKSNGTVFTVSEALSGHDKMWLEKFGDNISKIVQRYAPGFGGCSAGVTYAGLTAGGDLLPCVPAPIRLGNLLKEDLEDIWVNNELLTYMRKRDELSGTCGRCNYNSICGGCRYTAYAVNGDWLTGDPTCPFGPSTT
ncbi:MAG: radical SAM protein [Theionarchaea archaeon]|nr:radical SAM protein [Theionarchaea archaeon]